MKKRTFRLLLSSLFLFGFILNLQAQCSGSYPEGNFEEYVRFGDEENVAIAAGCYYEEHFILPNVGSENESEVTREFVEFVTLNMINANLNVPNNDFILNPFKLDYELGGENENATSDMLFEMFGNFSGCSDFIAIYVDYEEVYRTGVISSSPSFSMEVEGDYSRKLFVVKALCGESQTGLFIIIIDKDASLHSVFTIPVDLGEPEPTSGFQIGTSSNTIEDFDVFPNPTNGGQTEVKFNLIRDQSVSVSIIEGSTGRNIQAKQQLLEQGNHSQTLEMSDLPPGIYYVILQTDDDRKVEKVLKLE